MTVADALAGRAGLLHDLLQGLVVTIKGILVCGAGPSGWGGTLVSAEAPHWVCWGKSNLEGLRTRNEGVVSHLGGALVLDRWVGWGESAEECWGKGSGASPVDTAGQKWHPTVQGQLGKKGNKKNGTPPQCFCLWRVFQEITAPLPYFLKLVSGSPSCII